MGKLARRKRGKRRSSAESRIGMKERVERKRKRRGGGKRRLPALTDGKRKEGPLQKGRKKSERQERVLLDGKGGGVHLARWKILQKGGKIALHLSAVEGRIAGL